MSRIHLGAPVDVKVQSLDQTFTGTVARFAERLDTETRTMHVEVDVKNPTLELVPGMYADASITLDEAQRRRWSRRSQAIDRTRRQDARVLVVDAERRDRSARR